MINNQLLTDQEYVKNSIFKEKKLIIRIMLLEYINNIDYIKDISTFGDEYFRCICLERIDELKKIE